MVLAVRRALRTMAGRDAITQLAHRHVMAILDRDIGIELGELERRSIPTAAHAVGMSLLAQLETDRIARTTTRQTREPLLAGIHQGTFLTGIIGGDAHLHERVVIQIGRKRLARRERGKRFLVGQPFEREAGEDGTPILVHPLDGHNLVGIVELQLDGGIDVDIDECGHRRIGQHRNGHR